MRKLRSLLTFLLLCAPAFGATVFVSQSGGSVNCGADGTQTTTAQASVTWTAGNTYKLCGTFTSEMTVNASGSSGNLITITFESNGAFSAAAFNPAAIELGGQSFILVDGGTPCGRNTTCSANLSGTGVVQNTANGTGLGNNIGTTLVDIGQGSCGSNIEIRNLLVLNAYLKTSLSDEGNGSNNSNGISGTNCGSNILIHDNTVTYAHALIQEGTSTNAATNFQVYNNVVSSGTWGVNAQIGSTGSIIATNLAIYNNDINLGTAWSDPSGNFHLDGIFVFGQSSTATWNGVYLYNNYLHGNWVSAQPQCPTGFIYANQNLQNLYVFNNIFNITANYTCNGLLAIGAATVSQFVYNNTFLSYSSSGSGEAIGDVSANGANSTTIKNNIISTMQIALNFNHSTGADMVAIDHNDYYNVSGAGANGPWIVGSTFPATFSLWQACTTNCVATGSPDTHGSIGNPNLSASFIPQTGSVAIGLGVNLFSTCNGQPNPGLGALCFDAAGNARPQSAAWTAGALNNTSTPGHALIGLSTLTGRPTGGGTGGCATTGHTGTTTNYCGYIYYVTPNINGNLQNTNANSFDVGTTVPTFTGASSVDTSFTWFSPGFTVSGISNTAGTTTATLTSACTNCNWETGNVLYCASCGVYTGAWTLTGATYTGSGSGNLVSVTWSQGGSPGAVTSGNLQTACSGAQCRQEIVLAAATNQPQNSASPNYPFSQSWANTTCTQSPWIALANVPPHWCIWVSSVGHFYHSTGVCATTGTCQSGSGTPSWNTGGGTNSDGAVTWQDDGTTNAYPLEVLIGTNYTGCTSGQGLGGCQSPETVGVWNVNATNCGNAIPPTGTIQCTAALISQGFPLDWEQPWIYWINLIHACYDGDTLNAQLQCPGPHTGNPGVLFHYAGYGSNGFANPGQIDYVRFGVVAGGESFIWSYQNLETAFSLSDAQLSNIWTSAANKMYAAVANSWAQTSAPWHPMFTTNLFPATCTAQGCAEQAIQQAAYIASYHVLGLGSQGLQIGDLAQYATAPPNNVTTNDAVAMFAQYYSSVPFLQEQTANSSEIPGVSTIGNCNSAQIQTGNLAQVVPFAFQHLVNYVELYTLDVMATWDSNMTSALCVTYANAQTAGYPAALSNASQGLPNATSVLNGNAKLSGNAVQQ